MIADDEALNVRGLSDVLINLIVKYFLSPLISLSEIDPYEFTKPSESKFLKLAITSFLSALATLIRPAPCCLGEA